MSATTPSPFTLAMGSLIGSSLEWFDYFLYGTMATAVFAPQFFPSANHTISNLLAYLTFALTFFIRPLGGIVFAHIGDRYGRKVALVATLTMMGLGTSLIGVLPNAASIGMAAPLLLIVLRLVQGIGIGGEWGGALLLAYENAPPARRSLLASVPQMGVTIGMLMATLSVSLAGRLPEEAFQRWGWRLPFLWAGVTFLAGLWLRRAIPEPTHDVSDTGAPPILQVLRLHWREVLIAIGAKAVETGPFYILTVLLISYAPDHLGLPRATALTAVTIGAVVASLMIPLVGGMADRVGRAPIFLIGCLAMAAFAVPYFHVLDRHDPWLLTLATVIGFGLIWPLITAVLGSLLSELFPAQVRFTGITLGYQIGAALVGGTAPIIATGLLAQGGWPMVAGYIVLTAAVSALCVLIQMRRHSHSRV